MIRTTDHRLADLALSKIDNHPFVAWENALQRAVLSGSATLDEGPIACAATWSTYDRWRPAGAGQKTLVATIGASEQPVTLLSVSAHNLGQIGASLRWSYSVALDSDWIDIDANVLADDGVMAWRIMPTSARRWRLMIDVPAGMLASVGCVFIGAELVLPLPIYQGFSPRIVSTEVDLENNVTEGGNLIGAAVVRRGSTMTMPMTLMPAAFVRGRFTHFMNWFNSGRGVLLAWRPQKYPSDIHYGWRSGDVIRPENTGPLDRMGASMQLRLYDG